MSFGSLERLLVVVIVALIVLTSVESRALKHASHYAMRLSVKWQMPWPLGYFMSGSMKKSLEDFERQLADDIMTGIRQEMNSEQPENKAIDMAQAVQKKITL